MRAPPPKGSEVTALIYCGGPLYSGGDDVIADLRQSGFTTVVAWAVHVTPVGDLLLNGPESTLVQWGKYVGDPAWPGRLAALKQQAWERGKLNLGRKAADFPNSDKHPGTQGDLDLSKPASAAAGNHKSVLAQDDVAPRDGSSKGGSFGAQRSSRSPNGTSVNRLLFSIGGWETGDFTNIQKLIQEQGTGPHSILHQNFKALKKAIPDINGIDLDNEDTYDKEMTVEFSKMLHALGYEVTFCPYAVPDFWVDCLSTLNTQTPGLVSNFLLQCYSGGAANNPKDWVDAVAAKMGPTFDATGFVFPGVWSAHGEQCRDGDTPEEVAGKFREWKALGIRGGFIWLYDDVQNCARQFPPGAADTAAYAHAVLNGLSSA